MQNKLLSIQLGSLEANYQEFSTDGVPAHFYGANGFPTDVYYELTSDLSQKYALSSLYFRGCWEDIYQPNKQIDWMLYADDLIQFIEQKYTTPIVGIGHSQGATATLLAYIKRPDLFKELILIEPGSVSKTIQMIFNPMPLFIKKRIKPMKATKGKKKTWDDIDEYYQYLRQNKGYKRFDDAQLYQLASRSLSKSYTLLYDPVWEMYNYGKPRNLDNAIKKVEIPFKVIAGKPSLFLTDKVRKKWKQLNPHLQLIEIYEGGHLLPLEFPHKVAEVI
ncbi:alpha/beta fold hydrolase [Flammeovirga agarivorans]|uniref:Alpha/beta hydrolase n=1 Tax=Flammeovirga agarivorans TaxID=2726742 RepID=A0A7X8SGL5_9BACT|nr:alpha/beta hydrolase [Flammeovirga agarivorans]NLR89863.1 alpha/beta hydrolase [Flammeovirga agarivorans]